MDINSSSNAFLATSTVTYPKADVLAGSTTAADSEVATSANIWLESVVIEAVGGADGTVTIANHAGTVSFTLPILIAAARDYHYGPYGMRLKGFLGLRAVCSDATAKARIVFRNS